MTIKEFVDTYEKIQKMDNPMDALKDKGLIDILHAQRDELERYCEVAENTVLERISEKDLVRFMLMVQKSISSIATVNGDNALFLAEIEGSLQSFTQTVILATIGALIEDEIL